MGETRVDLVHLLEDLRDAYPGSLEETILTEVVANAGSSSIATSEAAVASVLRCSARAPESSALICQFQALFEPEFLDILSGVYRFLAKRGEAQPRR